MARSSRISEILTSLQELSEPIHVYGVSSAARSLLVVQLVQHARAQSHGPLDPFLIICANDDVAATFAADLDSLASTLNVGSLTTYLFPTWEQSPFSPIAPSIRTRLERVSTLCALSSKSYETAIVVTSIAALCQATIQPANFQKYSLSLKKDFSVESREALVSKLSAAGYLRLDPVEDPGTFAVRGEIIDIFPPGRERPLRIELFDDVIERIREFDRETQRAQGEASFSYAEVFIPPAREVLINNDTSALVRERLKSQADDVGITRAIRDPIIANLNDGIYPDHSDAWAPFAYESPATLLDYLSSGSRVIWNDELSAEQTWDQFREEQKNLSVDAIKSDLILPAPSELFRWDTSLQKRLKKISRLYLDQLELADLSTMAESLEGAIDPELVSGHYRDEAGTAARAAEPLVQINHCAFVRSNHDLISGSKDSMGELESKFKLWLRQGFQIICLASTQSQQERIRFLLSDRGFAPLKDSTPLASAITVNIGTLSEGFRWPAEGLVIVTESEMLGSRHVRSAKKKKSKSGSSNSAAKDWAGLQALSDLGVGDLVVHVDHGIGKYQGLVRLDLSGAPSDFLLLEYANKDKLYLPVYRLNVVQKYAGSGAVVALDKLGTQHFAKTKDKVREAIKKLAVDLIKLYAERKIRPGVTFESRDSEFAEFEAKFPFDETPDQLRAIDDCMEDMESGRVMDRLICGDVGYGKTEVAIRAAFRAVTGGKQVVVLVPTTVLAFQHEQSFKNRMKDYPITIESVSRFKTTKEQKTALEGVASGKVDIIIGTHRLLSRDVKFKDLGLVIVDEEHRFGVEHKEKLKTLKVNTHVMTLSATPIPRTLHMALSGLRDISLINTPPVDRLPIRTYVSKYDDSLIKRAIEVELSRGGQVFVLHNRVQTIYELSNRIRELVPQALVGVGHGQMAEGELENAMIGFYQKKTNVLVCTTIIESGLDVPSANTILINRADSLGLAQLYQIRGRVGRGQQRAYAYLLIPAEGAVTDDAKKRLEVIQRFVELGSGFQIASHDLEIRGGGDLLGAQQSGHIAAVGFDLYTELLEEAIRELEGKPLTIEESQREPEIKAPFAAFLGEEYVPDVHQRLSLYRRFSGSSTDGEVDNLEAELQDRYGALPVEALNLIWLIRIKQLLKKVGIDSLMVGPERVAMIAGAVNRIDPVRAIALIAGNPSKFQLVAGNNGESKLVVNMQTLSLKDLLFALEQTFNKLV